MFSECNHDENDKTSSSKHPTITSISHECPLNFKSEPTQLNNSWIEYAQLLAAASAATTSNNIVQFVNKEKKNKTASSSINIKKKYKNILKYKKKEFKKKLTISEIFSNSNILIEKENEIIIPLKSIKNELMEQNSV